VKSFVSRTRIVGQSRTGRCACHPDEFENAGVIFGAEDVRAINPALDLSSAALLKAIRSKIMIKSRKTDY
jgi:hypothetical protein